MRLTARFLACLLSLAFAGTGQAVRPVLPTPLPNEAVLLLSDMAAGDLTPSTIHIVVQRLLATDFGSHFFMAGLLARSVQADLVPEATVRATFGAYGCDHAAIRSWIGCRHSLEGFNNVLRLPLPQSPPPPPCVGAGSDLFTGVGFLRLATSVERSQGDPRVVSLVRDIPEETLQHTEHPNDGLVVINSPVDLNPALFCTLHAWRRSAEPPNRWQAVLQQLQCGAH